MTVFDHWLFDIWIGNCCAGASRRRCSLHPEAVEDGSIFIAFVMAGLVPAIHVFS